MMMESFICLADYLCRYFIFVVYLLNYCFLVWFAFNFVRKKAMCRMKSEDENSCDEKV